MPKIKIINFQTCFGANENLISNNHFNFYQKRTVTETFNSLTSYNLKNYVNNCFIKKIKSRLLKSDSIKLFMDLILCRITQQILYFHLKIHICANNKSYVYTIH